MTTLHEQARAEAEKRWPVGLYHVWDGNLPISSERFGGIARDSFKDGFLAGHEAATRTRVVSTVAELDALQVGSVVLCSDSQAREVMHSLCFGEMHGALRAFNGEHLIHEGRLLQVLPARVLYEPEETR